MTEKKPRAKRKRKAEVTSVRVFLMHLRIARVPPNVARNVFEKHGLDWVEFTKEGIEADKLIATGDAIAIKMADIADADERPIKGSDGEIRVFMRHVRAAELCKKGSQDFFRQHNLDYRDFLKNGISVRKLEEIGDPIALRAAHEAIEWERNGRK